MQKKSRNEKKGKRTKQNKGKQTKTTGKTQNKQKRNTTDESKKREETWNKHLQNRLAYFLVGSTHLAYLIVAGVPIKCEHYTLHML